MLDRIQKGMSIRPAPLVREQAVIDDDVAAQVVRRMIPEDFEREAFFVLLLDARGRARRLHVISIGTMTASIVHPREVFRPAILHGAITVVLAHNHPSGNPSPSAEDLSISKRIVNAGVLLGIDVVDFIVVGADTHVSLAKEGRI